MHILLPFPHEHLRMAEQWMSWVRQLQCGRNHYITLFHGKGCDLTRIQEIAKEAFSSVSLLEDAEDIHGHPQGPNSMMRQAVWHLHMNGIGPTMFCEPDNIPLRADSFDVYEREYRAFGKDFMGKLVQPTDGITPPYLSGNMMIPKDVLMKSQMLGRRGLSVDGVELAFDIVAAREILPQAHTTKLQQQVPKNPDGSSITFPDQESLSILDPEAVFFHPCKDGSLVERLRERNELQPTIITEVRVQEPTSISETMQVSPSVHAAVCRERDDLLREVQQLKSLLTQPVTVEQPKTAIRTGKRGRKMKAKPQRTPDQQARIDERMAKARAARKKNTP